MDKCKKCIICTLRSRCKNGSHNKCSHLCCLTCTICWYEIFCLNNLNSELYLYRLQYLNNGIIEKALRPGGVLYEEIQNNFNNMADNHIIHPDSIKFI